MVPPSLKLYMHHGGCQVSVPQGHFRFVDPSVVVTVDVILRVTCLICPSISCGSKENRSLRVVRVELDNGQRLVGLRYPEQLIPEVILFLNQQKLLDTALVSIIFPSIFFLFPPLTFPFTRGVICFSLLFHDYFILCSKTY